jgi:uncharacterized glyoxalase superfamily protein PhnB
MKLTFMRPMLWVPDVREACDWYVTELGFTEGEFNEEWQWASLYRDEVSIMIAKPNEHTPYKGPEFTGSFYFNTTDVEAWWELLKDKPYLLYPIETFDWEMREFAIKDLNGFILQFGQAISNQ